jgi:drug/metabolite transporter (DMT)-like permease
VGYLYALLAALLFGMNGSVTRVVMDAGLTAAQLTLFRVATAAIIAGAFLLVANRSAFKVNLRQLVILGILGILGVAMLQFTYAVAISLLPVGITLLLEYLAVLLVALVAFFVFREKVKARLWVAIGCVLVGLAFVAQIWASELNPLGVVFALLAATMLTIYFVVGEREVGKTSPMAVAFWTMSFATVFWLLFSGWWNIDPAIFTETVSLSGNFDDVFVPFWVPLLWNMVVGTFAPFFLSLLALKYLSATAAGVVASSEVLFAFLVAWVWLGEGLGPLQMAGALIVLIGIVLAQTARVNKVVDADLALTDAPQRSLA